MQDGYNDNNNSNDAYVCFFDVFFTKYKKAYLFGSGPSVDAPDFALHWKQCNAKSGAK